MNEREVLAAPLDGITEGHLVFRRGLDNAILAGDATIAELYTVRGTGRAPLARCSGGTVELTFPLISSGTRGHPDIITLNGSIPWEVEVVGGVGDLRADLTCVSVRSIDVEGGTARTSVDLSHPDGTMSIRLGEVRETTIRRPSGVPVRVRVRRGARRTTVDDETVAAINGPATFASPGYDGAIHRLDVSVDVADHLTVTTTGPARSVGAPGGDVMLAASTWLARLGATGVSWPALEGSASPVGRQRAVDVARPRRRDDDAMASESAPEHGPSASIPRGPVPGRRHGRHEGGVGS